MGSESQNKAQLKNSSQKKAICICFAIVVALAPFLSKQTSDTIVDFYGDTMQAKPKHVKLKLIPSDLSQFNQCENTKFDVQAPAEYTTKPIFLASSSSNIIRNDIHSGLIDKMTGTSAGAKMFIRSSPSLKHCIGNGQTVTCVAAGYDNASDKKVGIFHDKYIMFTRNPFTAFASGYNYKSEMFRSLEGQESIEKWRSARDAWYQGAVNEFKDNIQGWAKTKFKQGMNIVFEDLFDIDNYIIVMKKLRQFLIDAGFQVVPEEQLPCIWYLALGKERIENYHRHGYEYGDYKPGYTEEQKKKLIDDLKEYEKSLEGESDDSDLKAIVHRYVEDSERNVDIDIAAPKKDD
ncbi:hypothetical protein CTEN210_00114 [Chaetoceros tenuissimus]|uniref:Sulfotransferase domain-containing protein n=1 Tax=Chaetoceros tenuissimus TaxID=426638 RepID=A0AAD3CF44_9STRA|nr:hypothetical protein CTEN210_00114 [Chaetoceros tenuissimus]